jgi:hypothetical protein
MLVMAIQLRFRQGAVQLVETSRSLLNAIERAHHLWTVREGELFCIYADSECLLAEAEIRDAWKVRNLRA